MAHHLFMHDKERKLDSRQLMKILKADLVPMGNNRRMSQEIVLAKFFAFVQSSEGDLFHMHCSQYYEAHTTHVAISLRNCHDIMQYLVLQAT